VNLTIDLGRLKTNYRVICEQLNGVEAAAVVKADGYGLGAVEVSRALTEQGCRRFFVAQLAEAEQLRQALGDRHAPQGRRFPGDRQALEDIEIQVLSGALDGTTDDLIELSVIPVLNSLEQIDRWAGAAKQRQQKLRATIHLDTGMNRTGLGANETAVLLDEPWRLDPLEVVHVMSHLASADIADSPQSAQQLRRFEAHRRCLSTGTASLANSAGIFLGPAYHFDLARPGVALYGGNPCAGSGNPMRQVVSVTAPILQVRSVGPGDAVGYGATRSFDRPGRVATVPVGYADGYFRAASNAGVAYLGSVPVPVVGRVSMDLITLDVSAVAESELRCGAEVELIGDRAPIDEVAQRAGTIPHEVLAALGTRYRRCYVDERGCAGQRGCVDQRGCAGQRGCACQRAE